MRLVGVACLALVVLATLLHYEALRLVSAVLPRLRMAPRARLIGWTASSTYVSMQHFWRNRDDPVGD